MLYKWQVFVIWFESAKLYFFQGGWLWALWVPSVDDPDSQSLCLPQSGRYATTFLFATECILRYWLFGTWIWNMDITMFINGKRLTMTMKNLMVMLQSRTQRSLNRQTSICYHMLLLLLLLLYYMISLLVSYITEPHTEIVGSPNIYLEEGATLNLTCLVLIILIKPMIMVLVNLIFSYLRFGKALTRPSTSSGTTTTRSLFCCCYLIFTTTRSPSCCCCYSKSNLIYTPLQKESTWPFPICCSQYLTIPREGE